jgi:hypothetical protein
MNHLSQAQLDQRRRAARNGGLALLLRYGPAHFAELGRKGAAVFHKKYRLQPINTSDFAIVDRETGKIINTIHGGWNEKPK